jgi:lysophospholipase L1-like esterase
MTLKDYEARRSKMLSLKSLQNPPLVFLGDSITEGWRDAGEGVWQRVWQPMDALCLGLGGDQTQNLLWRLDQGELQGLSPRVIVVLIGVNNLWWGGWTPSQTAKGIQAVVSYVQRLLPQTQVVVHGILPASRSRTDDLRQRIGQCNDLAKQGLQSAHHPKVHWLDLGDVFVKGDGAIEAKVMHDYLHLSPLGYEVWAQGLKPQIDRLLTGGC